MHLESINGYHGELDDGISIYSKMLANKISVPTANVINSFINFSILSAGLILSSHHLILTSVYRFHICIGSAQY